jgi:signal transduction histidine kinase
VREHAQWREALFAALVHDLRGPLGNVLTWSHLLRQGGLDGEAAERALEAVQRNAELQMRMLEDFVEYSALAGPEPELASERIDLATVVGATVSGLLPRARRKPVELGSDLAAGAGGLLADRRRLELAVRRLLEHAIEAAPASSRVAVALRSTNDDLQLEISHAGAAVPADEMARAFEPAPAAGHGRGNLRLELALAARVARLHGGRLEGRSLEPGPGTRFVLRLPRS